MLDDVTAFAPATVANVGIGFVSLGHTVDVVGDTVRLTCIARPEVRILSITGIAGNLPVVPEQNTAGRAVQVLHQALGLEPAGAARRHSTHRGSAGPRALTARLPRDPPLPLSGFVPRRR